MIITTEMLSDLREQQRLNPTCARIQGDVATVLCRLERYDEAAGAYLQALSFASEDEVRTRILTNFGITLCTLGRWTEARLQLEAALSMDSPPVDAFYYAASAYIHLGDVSGAKAVVGRGLATYPGHWTLEEMLGQCFNEMEEYVHAIQMYTSAHIQNPNAAWVLANRGKAYMDSGDTPSALRDFQGALSIDPNDEFSKEMLTLLTAQT